MTGLQLQCVGIGRLDHDLRVDRHPVFDDRRGILHEALATTDGVHLSKSCASPVVARLIGCKQRSILNAQQFRGRLLLDRAKGTIVVCCAGHVTTSEAGRISRFPTV
jgi:hypothetical protein